MDEQDLIDAIQRGQVVLSKALRHDAERAGQRHLLASLTGREREVLSFVAQGLATKDIALALALSPRTVESHRASICAKLETTSVAELTRIWLGQETPLP